MSIGRGSVLATIALATALGGVGQAHAGKVFKGVAVVTARTATAPCVAEYDVSESFIVEFLANVGTEAGTERLALISTNGSLLLSNNDATPTLRGVGSASVSGNVFAQPVTIPSIATNFTITPVVAATTSITLSGTASNLGIPGCNVTIRAALTWLPAGGY